MRSILKKWAKIDWIQSFIINVKVVGFRHAFTFPIIIFHGFKIKQLKGNIVFNVPLEKGLITFGHPYEIFTRTAHLGEAHINGTIIINGKVQFGVDTKLYVLEKGTITFGHINSFATNTQVVCFQSITFGNYVQCGKNCQFEDTQFHAIINESNQSTTRDGKIQIGSFNYLGSNILIKSNCITPNNCMVSSYSLLNKDYLSIGENITLAGFPAKLVNNTNRRNWENELPDLEQYLKSHY